jgi:hypothetical protein
MKSEMKSEIQKSQKEGQSAEFLFSQSLFCLIFRDYMYAIFILMDCRYRARRNRRGEL